MFKGKSDFTVCILENPTSMLKTYSCVTKTCGCILALLSMNSKHVSPTALFIPTNWPLMKHLQRKFVFHACPQSVHSVLRVSTMLVITSS